MTSLDLAAAFIPALHKPSALLPIAKHREGILYLIETFPVVIVVGQTGSGKTTQIPQFLENAGWCAGGKVIAITQVSHSFSAIVSSKCSFIHLILTECSPEELRQPLLLCGWLRSTGVSLEKRWAIPSGLMMLHRRLRGSNT